MSGIPFDVSEAEEYFTGAEIEAITFSPSTIEFWFKDGREIEAWVDIHEDWNFMLYEAVR